MFSKPVESKNPKKKSAPEAMARGVFVVLGSDDAKRFTALETDLF